VSRVTFAALATAFATTLPCTPSFAAGDGAQAAPAAKNAVAVKSVADDLPTRVFDAARNSVLRTLIARQVDGGTGYASGTAFVISKSGYALTCSHVVGDGRGEKTVKLHDRRSYPFEVILAAGNKDVALIKLIGDVPFEPVRLGRSADLRVGDTIVAVGNHGGVGLKAAEGQVMELNASSTYHWWPDGATYRTDLLRVNADITGGDSGGAVMNEHGEVVGLIGNTRTIGDRSGFAMPMDHVLDEIPGMFAAKRKHDFVLGMTVDLRGPARVTEVTPGTCAATAGITAGDIVTAVEKTPVDIGLEVHAALAGRQAGDVVHLQLDRGGEATGVDVTLDGIEPRPADTVEGLVPGLVEESYGGSWPGIPDFPSLQPASTRAVNDISVQSFADQDDFALRFTGYLHVPSDGVYSFFTTSDDGSQLRIGDRLVVDNDGLHASLTEQGFMPLKAGFHSISVAFLEFSGGEQLAVEYEGPGIERQAIPGSALFRPEGK